MGDVRVRVVQDVSDKIVRLPGARLTPETVLAQLLEKKDRLKAVAVFITWDDDSFDIDWSQQPATTLAAGGVLMQSTAVEILRGGGHESVVCTYDEPA